MARVTIPYKPRDAFMPLHNRTERWASIVAHRRAGKTVAAINDKIKRAITFKGNEGRFALVAPYRQQAKDVAWSYLKFYTGVIPGIEISESELHVTLPHNGARIRLYGSDNYDAMRGIYLDGVTLDEYADHHPQAWREVIRPALADRRGWATFIGTSKGKNAFYDMQMLAESSPEWFALRLRASETGLLPDTELSAMRAQMSANEYAREMECDFDAAIEGAYFADGLAEAEREGRIANVAADKLLRLRAYVDIGGVGKNADAFAMWIVQFIGREIRVLNYYEAEGQQLSAHVHWLHTNGYPAGAIDIYLPHDGAAEKGPYAGAWESAFRDAGFNVETIIGAGSGRAGAPMVRIEAVRRLLPFVWFNRDTTQFGRDRLASYHERRDDKRGVGLGPDHDKASHGADAFGLMAVAYEIPQRAAKINYSSRGIV